MKIWEITRIDNSLYSLKSGHTQSCASEFELDWFNKDWDGKTLY
jgi:hypothetical protein